MAEYPPEVLQRFQGSPEQMVNGVVREPPRGWRTIAIEDYDPAWADRFDAVSAVLRDALGPLAIVSAAAKPQSGSPARYSGRR